MYGPCNTGWDKSLETTMRYLAPATDVQDELDLVTIPSVGKAAPVPRKDPARETDQSRKRRTAQLAAEVRRAERVMP